MTSAPLAQIDVNPLDAIGESVDGMLDAIFGTLPNLLVGLIVLGLFVLVGRVVRRRVEPRLVSSRTRSFGRVGATLLYAAIVVVGVFVAVPIAFPTVNAVTVLSGLGLLGVAAGFAFQDILSNLLAGVLLILRQPFEAGDQVEVDGHRGTVELITIRETLLRTFRGHRVYVPNADVYTNAIDVQTAYDQVRTDLAVGVGYDSDLDEARRVALDAIAGIDGVLAEPAPQAWFTGFGASSMNFDLRYWTASSQADVRGVQDRVVQAVYDAYDDADVDIPFTIVTLEAAPSFDEAVGARS